jgi:hypothetical protein
MRTQNLRGSLRTLVIPLCLAGAIVFTGCAKQRPPSAAGPKEAPASLAAVDRAAETAAVRQALHHYVGSSDLEAPVDVDLAQVAIDSGYALVSWTHEDEGGQAVLHKEGGVWVVKDCGPGWLGLRGVCKAVPPEVAKRLLDQLDPNWPSYEAR